MRTLTVRPALAPALRREAGMQFWLPAVSLLVIAMVNASFAEGLRLGADVPVRTILAIVLFGCILLAGTANGVRLIESRATRWLLALWFLLIVWLLISNAVTGANMTAFFRKTVGRHFSAFVMFIAILLCARGRKRLELLVNIFIGLICLSSFVAILQWRGVDLAWRLPIILNAKPETIEGVLDVDVEDVFVAGQLVLGLNGSPHVFGYYLAAGATMILPLLLQSKHQWFRIGQLLLLMATLLVLQQRAALLAFGIVVAALGLASLRNLRNRSLSIAVALLAIGGGGFLAYSWVRSESAKATYSLYRLGKLDDEERVTLAYNTLALASENLVFGSSPGEIRDRVGRLPPHNLFMNSLLWHGLPGLLIVAMMFCICVLLAYQAWRMGWRRMDYATAGCGASLVAYLVCAQFHNPGFLNGDYLNWWLIGFAIAGNANLRESAASTASGMLPYRPATGPWPNGRRMCR